MKVPAVHMIFEMYSHSHVHVNKKNTMKYLFYRICDLTFIFMIASVLFLLALLLV